MKMLGTICAVMACCLMANEASARWVTQCNGGSCQRVWVADRAPVRNTMRSMVGAPPVGYSYASTASYSSGSTGGYGSSGSYGLAGYNTTPSNLANLYGLTLQPGERLVSVSAAQPATAKPAETDTAYHRQTIKFGDTELREVRESLFEELLEKLDERLDEKLREFWRSKSLDLTSSLTVPIGDAIATCDCPPGCTCDPETCQCGPDCLCHSDPTFPCHSSARTLAINDEPRTLAIAEKPRLLAINDSPPRMLVASR